MRESWNYSKRYVFSIILTFMLVLSGALVLLGTGDQNDVKLVSASSTREVHGVISIDGDANFTSMASSEGWAGLGIGSDPYIIEDYEISGVDSRWCIRINSTTVHFVIRDCVLHNTTGGVGTENLWTGLSLINVTNGLVDGVVCRDIGDGEVAGINIENSHHLTIRNSLVHDCNRSSLDGTGMVIMESHNLTIDDLTLINNGGPTYSYGLFMGRSNDNSISNLTSLKHTGTFDGFGVYLADSHRNRFVSVNCSYNVGGVRSEGFRVWESGNNSFSNIEMHDNQNTGSSHAFFLYESNFNEFKNMNISNSSYGLGLYYSHNNLLASNLIQDCDYGFFLFEADNNLIEDNVILDTTLFNFGSCPFLYTYNGEEMELIGDVNGMGGLGYSFDMTVNGGGPRERRQPTSIDFTAIDSSQLEPQNGNYVMELVEEQDEITYFDSAELWVIDHSPDVEIYNPEAALCTFDKELFEPIIHTVKKPVQPISATDWNGNDISEIIASQDGILTDAQLLNDNFITLDLGDLSEAPQIKLIYSGYTDWSPIGALKENAYAEVINEHGEWGLVGSGDHLGKPEALQRAYVMDITDWFRTDDYRLRLHTGNIKIHIDWIAVDTSLDEIVTVTKVQPTSAEHFFKGPIHPTFEQFLGDFTKYGDVLPLLEATDDKFVIMKDGDAVRLEFDQQPDPAQDRDFWLVTDAYFKQPFVKYLMGEELSTVEPLPFHSMSNYPYPSDENYPDDVEYLQYLSEWNTRSYTEREGAGMSLPRSDNNTVRGNNIKGSETCTGLILDGETNATLINNNISGVRIGIQAYTSENVLIEGNRVFDCVIYGISVSYSSQFTVKNNWVMNNSNSAIRLWDCDNLTIYNNYFDSPVNANISTSENITWNISLTEGPNILGGNHIGGNFWNDYLGEDINGDWIGDTLVPHGPGDLLPLVVEKIPPMIFPQIGEPPKTGDEFNIHANAEDVGGKVQLWVEYWFDDGERDRIPMFDTIFSFIGIVNVPDDAHMLYYRIIAEDVAGNTNITEVIERIVIDNDAPELLDVIYQNFTLIGEPTPIIVHVQDNIGVNLVNLSYVDLGGISHEETMTLIDGDYMYTIPGQNDIGVFFFSIDVSDVAGNSPEITDYDLNIFDNIPPEVSINSPANGSIAEGNVQIEIFSRDLQSGLSYLSVQISSGTVIELYNSTPTQEFIGVSWNTTAFENGEYTLIAKAVDLDGTVNFSVIEVTVENIPVVTPDIPELISTSLPDSMVNVSLDVVITLEYSISMDLDSLKENTTIHPDIKMTWNISVSGTTITITFPEDLAYDTGYTIVIGRSMAANGEITELSKTFSFRTVDETPVPDDDDIQPDDDDDTSKKGISTGVIIAMIVILVFILIAILVIVVLVRKSGKEKDWGDEE